MSQRLSVALLAAGCIGVLASCVTVCPTDAQLIALFQLHRGEISDVVMMLREDRKLRWVDEDRTEPADFASAGVTSQRIARYRELLRVIGGADWVNYDPDSERATLVFWSQGMAGGGGSSKSIVYSPVPPAPLLTGLDYYQPPAGVEVSVVYRRIEGPWYLEYEQN